MFITAAATATLLLSWIDGLLLQLARSLLSEVITISFSLSLVVSLLSLACPLNLLPVD